MPKIFVVQINVTDMAEALDFYCNKLGFKVTGDSYYPEIVELLHQDSDRIPFILSRVKTRSKTVYPDGTQTLISLQTDDLGITLRVLKEKGVRILSEKPQSFPGGIFAAIEDPFGNVIEYCERIPQAHVKQMKEILESRIQH